MGPRVGFVFLLLLCEVGSRDFLQLVSHQPNYAYSLVTPDTLHCIALCVHAKFARAQVSKGSSVRDYEHRHRATLNGIRLVVVASRTNIENVEPPCTHR